MECTIVQPRVEENALSSAAEEPFEYGNVLPDHPDYNVAEGDWMDHEDSEETKIAFIDSALRHRESHRSFAAAAMVSVVSHVVFVALGLLVLARTGDAIHLRVARGDPAAQSGPLRSGIAQPDQAEPIDSSKFDQKFATLPRMPTPQKAPASPVLDETVGESSALRDQVQPPTIAPPDVVIGIGAARSGTPLPHFSASGLKGRSNNNLPAPRYSISGGTTPPSVAAPSGGRRGEKDGFDSRGLAIPDYPAESRRRGEEGTVVVDVEVLASGSVGTIHIVSDAGYPRLGAAAAEKLKLAVFEPARQSGKAVVGHLLIPYRFTLE
jgi:TonB family protein